MMNRKMGQKDSSSNGFSFWCKSAMIVEVEEKNIWQKWDVNKSTLGSSCKLLTHSSMKWLLMKEYVSLEWNETLI